MTDDQPLTWQVRLSARDPRRLYGVLLCCVVAALAGVVLFRSVGFALIGFIVVAASTSEYWLPQSFKVDRNGATARYGMTITAINWADVKRVIPDEQGVKLSPLAGDGRLNAFRGVYLRFNGNREEVLERISLARGANE